MEYRPPLHLGVVAIENRAFGLPLTKVANFTFTLYFDPEVNSAALLVWIKDITKLTTQCMRERERGEELS